MFSPTRLDEWVILDSVFHASENLSSRFFLLNRRMGENDAWQAAFADQMGAILVGHDPRAFRRLGDRYEDHRAE
jgi:predicted nucleic acid-binding protein